jgi:hypothetical protein
MEGVRKCVYLAEQEGFKLYFNPNVISLKRIFEKIKVLGKERNLTYKSYTIPIREEV